MTWFERLTSVFGPLGWVAVVLGAVAWLLFLAMGSAAVFAIVEDSDWWIRRRAYVRRLFPQGGSGGHGE